MGTKAGRRAVVVALLVTAGLTGGCEAEPSTSTEGGDEQPVPGEPGAPETAPTPDTNITSTEDG